MKKLENKIVLITGASSGIGEAVAKRFAKEGANVIVVSNLAVEKGKKVCEELIKMGSHASYFQADVSNEEQVKQMFSDIEEKYGRLDILINNAGSQVASPFGSTTMDMLDQDMRVNALAPFLLAQYASKLMPEKGWIINTSSFRAIHPRPPIAGYSASKAALNNITESLALILAPNIFVNAVLPGFVETENYKKFDEKMKQNWIKSTPIKRFISTSEMAEVFLFLATTEILTGTTIVADGGVSLLQL